MRDYDVDLTNESSLSGHELELLQEHFARLDDAETRRRVEHQQTDDEGTLDNGTD